jgi:hypothetical protein
MSNRKDSISFPTSVAALVADLLQLKNVLATAATVLGALASISNTPIAVKVAGLATMLVTVLATIIADLQAQKIAARR